MQQILSLFKASFRKANSVLAWPHQKDNALELTTPFFKNSHYLPYLLISDLDFIDKMFSSYKLHRLISPSNDSSEKKPKTKKQVILKGIEDIQYCPLDNWKKKKKSSMMYNF